MNKTFKNANRWLLLILVLLGSVVVRSQSEKQEIGKAVTGDIKLGLKPIYMEILASSDLLSWNDLKTRFQAVKDATSNFETKYKNQLAGSAVDNAAQAPASVPSPAQNQASQPAVQVNPAEPMVEQHVEPLPAPAVPITISEHQDQPIIAPAPTVPAIIPASDHVLQAMPDTSVMTPAAQIQPPLPQAPLPQVPEVPVAPAAQIVQPVPTPVTAPVVQAPTPAPMPQQAPVTSPDGQIAGQPNNNAAFVGDAHMGQVTGPIPVDTPVSAAPAPVMPAAPIVPAPAPITPAPEPIVPAPVIPVAPIVPAPAPAPQMPGM